jgi:hypothetical protein
MAIKATEGPRPDGIRITVLEAARRVPETAVRAYIGWFWLGPGAELSPGSDDRQLALDGLRGAFQGATRQSFFREVLPMQTGM